VERDRARWQLSDLADRRIPRHARSLKLLLHPIHDSCCHGDRTGHQDRTSTASTTARIRLHSPSGARAVLRHGEAQEALPTAAAGRCLLRSPLPPDTGIGLPIRRRRSRRRLEDPDVPVSDPQPDRLPCAVHSEARRPGSSRLGGVTVEINRRRSPAARVSDRGARRSHESTISSAASSASMASRRTRTMG